MKGYVFMFAAERALNRQNRVVLHVSSIKNYMNCVGLFCLWWFLSVSYWFSHLILSRGVSLTNKKQSFSLQISKYCLVHRGDVKMDTGQTFPTGALSLRWSFWFVQSKGSTFSSVTMETTGKGFNIKAWVKLQSDLELNMKVTSKLTLWSPSTSWRSSSPVGPQGAEHQLQHKENTSEDVLIPIVCVGGLLHLLRLWT